MRTHIACILCGSRHTERTERHTAFSSPSSLGYRSCHLLILSALATAHPLSLGCLRSPVSAQLSASPGGAPPPAPGIRAVSQGCSPLPHGTVSWRGLKSTLETRTMRPAAYVRSKDAVTSQRSLSRGNHTFLRFLSPETPSPYVLRDEPSRHRRARS